MLSMYEEPNKPLLHTGPEQIRVKICAAEIVFKQACVSNVNEGLVLFIAITQSEFQAPLKPFPYLLSNSLHFSSLPAVRQFPPC